MSDSSDDKGLTVSRVAKVFGVAPDTVRRWEDTGFLVPYRLPSGHRRWHRADVEAAMRRMGLESRISLLDEQ